MKPRIEHPKVFISYAWASDEYQDKVLALATDLIGDGVDVILDKWSLKEGNDTFAFMEHCVTDPTVTNVLILLDPLYEKKANERSGGVGTETQIISAEVYKKVTQEKFLPVVFQRGDDGAVPKPAYLKGLLHFDLSRPENYDSEYQRLVRRLYGIESYPKPEIGTTPAWLDNTPTVTVKVRSKVDSLKKSNLPDKVRLSEFREFIGEVAHKLEVYGNDLDLPGRIPPERYLEIAEGTIPLRDEFLQAFLLVPYIEGGPKVVAECLEGVAVNLDRDYSQMKDIRKTVLHELFIYLIAIYYKTHNYEALSYTINKTYFGPSYHSQMDGQSFRIFYSNDEYLDKAINQRDNKNYYCGTAAFWIEHINVDVCSKAEFVFADELCYNAAMLTQNYDDSWYWFPQTYVYAINDNSMMRTFSVKLKSKEHLAVAANIFGYDSTDKFIVKFKEIETAFHEGKLRNYRYNAAFESASVICEFVKTEELGTRN